jgi:hypothetical protein
LSLKEKGRASPPFSSCSYFSKQRFSEYKEEALLFRKYGLDLDWV